VALRVQEAMARKDFGLAEVAQIVGADAVLAADILRCANSALYRRGGPVTDLTAAITPRRRAAGAPGAGGSPRSWPR
jgi:HD-like signal output (HDOD) protein